MSFLDVFRSPGRKLTAAENDEINGTEETPIQRLKRIKAEVAEDTQAKAVAEVARVLPEVYEIFEKALREGRTLVNTDRMPELSGFLAISILVEHLKHMGVTKHISSPLPGQPRGIYWDLGGI